MSVSTRDPTSHAQDAPGGGRFLIRSLNPDAVFTREDARYLATSSNDFIGRVFDVSGRNEMWHLPLRVDDFFPLQFTDRDKYVLWAASIGDEVLVERHPWRLRDMLDDACAIVSRDLTTEEWKPYSDLELQACPSSVKRR